MAKDKRVEQERKEVARVRILARQMRRKMKIAEKIARRRAISEAYWKRYPDGYKNFGRVA